VLSIDDAFAGGACRCQHCGTIQTVPSHLKRATSPGKSAPRATKSSGSSGNGKGAGSGAQPSSKVLYKRRARGDGSDTGLEELAEIVASSSGLAGSGLRSSRLRQGEPGKGDGTASGAPSRSLTPLLAAATVIILVLVVMVLWLSLGRDAPQPVGNVSPQPSQPNAPTEGELAGAPSPRYQEPNFCGTKLDAPVVIYVLDRGNGTRDLFDILKEVTYKSIGSLGAERKFQVIFWNNGSDEAYPPGLPAYATRENLAACRRAFEDVAAFNQSDAVPALTKAVANRAGEIMLATGKGADLESSLVEQVMSIRKNNPVKVHTFALGDAESPVLRDIANRTGGQYKTVPAATLRTFTE
jgi:hypothetical protein